jgi:D-sedoheptulose 7-phosphate isomerase
MDLQTSVENSLLEHTQVISRILSELAPSIVVVGNVLATVLAGGGTVFWCGNGGSAADSQHMAGELIGRFVGDRQPLRSMALTTDSSVLTCIANDYDYREVFARQVEALVGQGDVLMVLSTSGNSENVVRALEVARGRGAVTVALLGKGGGIAGEAADHAIVVDSDSTARIQEAHIVIGHIVCELIEKELGLA